MGVFSARVMEAIERDARESGERFIEAHVPFYDRAGLEWLAAGLSAVALHDYSEDGTRLVIEKLKLKIEAEERLMDRESVMAWSRAYRLAPFHAALRVEEQRLRRI